MMLTPYAKNLILDALLGLGIPHFIEPNSSRKDMRVRFDELAVRLNNEGSLTFLIKHQGSVISEATPRAKIMPGDEITLEKIDGSYPLELSIT